MRTLQLLTHRDLRPGGAVQACRLAGELSRRGHRVTLAYNPEEPGRRVPPERFERLERDGMVVAEEVKRVLVRDGLAPEKVAVVYGSVDTEVFHPGVDGAAVRREFFPEEPGLPIVGMLGKLDEKKSHDVFLEMGSRLLDGRIAVRFAAVGRGDAGRFAGAIERLGLEGKGIFPGYRADAGSQ